MPPIHGGRSASRTAGAAGLSVAPTRQGRQFARCGIPYLLLTIDSVAFLIAALLARGGGLGLLFLWLLALAVNAQGGLYRRRLVPSALDDAPSLVVRGTTAGCVVVAGGALNGSGVDSGVLAAAVLFAVLAVLGRGLTYSVLRRARRRTTIADPTLLFGGGTLSGRLARVLLDHPEYGLAPVGFIDDDPFLPSDQRPVPHLGGNDVLQEVVRRHSVRNIVVAFGSTREPQLVDVVRSCDRLPCEIFLVPRLYELPAARADTELLWGIPVVRLRRAAFRTPAWRMKRVLDVVLASVALVLLAPLMAACALIVRWETGSAVLFRQQRVGLDGRVFTLLKFCSLTPGSEHESATLWSVADDARLRPIGRFLRRTSLDELPQLFNIIRGDMSLVGPRPERPAFVTSFTEQFPRYTARHRVPAGLTGWAQVHGLRGNTSIHDRVHFDNSYIDNWSLGLDIKIVILSLTAVFKAAGG